jgi:hypothetical protein
LVRTPNIATDDRGRRSGEAIIAEEEPAETEEAAEADEADGGAWVGVRRLVDKRRPMARSIMVPER